MANAKNNKRGRNSKQKPAIHVGETDSVDTVSDLAQILEETTLEVTITSAKEPSAGATPITLPLSPPLSPEQSISSIATNNTAAMSSTRLFVASLGNPAPYQSTRHSAGHVLLRALQSHLRLPPLRKSKAGGLVSAGADVGRPEYTLWQSPGYMNESGKHLLKAYKQFAADTRTGGNLGLPGLVVLHDEMESAPGLLKSRNGNMSAKGHNGIRSVQQSLQSAGLMAKLTEPGAGGGIKFIKVGIGIGRPAGGSREPSAVSAYVLANFSGPELSNLVGSAGSLVTILEDARAGMSD
ncbi:hypothetical protein LQW54_005524 [Pestalotiopsis sp. IQ-011]